MKRVILLLNSAGLLAYLFWLVFKAGQIFYTQEGVLYLLPVLPFVFVYALALAPREAPGEEQKGDSDG